MQFCRCGENAWKYDKIGSTSLPFNTNAARLKSRLHLRVGRTCRLVQGCQLSTKGTPRYVHCGPITTYFTAVMSLTWQKAKLDQKAAVDGGLVAVVEIWAPRWCVGVVVVLLRPNSPLQWAVAAAAQCRPCLLIYSCLVCLLF
jgi:hypothetical protein